MNKYLEELVIRLKKIADIPAGFDRGVLVISKDEALDIVADVQVKYNSNLWNPICTNKYPKNKYGESSRPLLVKYKDKMTDPEVCVYDFETKKFIKMDKDITDSITEWCEIPGYGYDE